MDTITIILAFFLGIGLSASAGFRIFLPLFILSIATKFGFHLEGGLAWIGSWAAIITLGVATFVEIIAYYIPWVDNILDTIAVPLAGLAGTLLMALSLGGIDSEVLQWGLAIIAGGGTAATIKGGTAGTRILSTVGTGGFGNFLISSMETLAASLLSILSILLAPLAFVLVIIIFYYIYKSYNFYKKGKVLKR